MAARPLLGVVGDALRVSVRSQVAASTLRARRGRRKVHSLVTVLPSFIEISVRNVRGCVWRFIGKLVVRGRRNRTLG